MIIQEPFDHDKARRAMCVLLRRLANHRDTERPGVWLYDIEAAWTIGVLASALEITDDEIVEMGRPYSIVEFIECGGRKIAAIKKVREIAHPCGLKEAKDLVEGTITMRVPDIKAQRIKAECEDVSPGCEVEITPAMGLAPLLNEPVSDSLDAKNNQFTPSA